MPYRRQKLVTAALKGIKPYDVLYIHGKRYGVSRTVFTPNKRISQGKGFTDILELEVRPWLKWKGWLKTHQMVALCAGYCNHGNMHIVTQADKDHTRPKPPKIIRIAVNKYNRKPWIKKREEK